MYFNEAVGNGNVHNSAETYDRTFKAFEKRTFKYYGKEINAFYDALERYSFNGKTALIWGLAGCNCEALAVWNKASKVYVVDYNKPICDYPSIEVLTHSELNTRELKTDFAISYSSFEHDGLGRYGDPIDPNGDIKAMQTARNALNENGILFFGVPLGKDALYWNAHRIYGKIRLPLLLKGWRCIDVFNVYSESPFDEANKVGSHRQSLMILRKIKEEYPSDAELKEIIDKQSDRSAHNHRVLSEINQFVLDHKKERG
ncbi:MAG: DUF268 domain-containing protein [Helicobacteraceae bacterium]|jgi:hypothetical protein|nr:DUF268 domain-containing protein [Helicobacteraceae bacterium]